MRLLVLDELQLVFAVFLTAALHGNDLCRAALLRYFLTVPGLSPSMLHDIARPLVLEKRRITGLFGKRPESLHHPLLPGIYCALYLGWCVLRFGSFEAWNFHGFGTAHEILAEVIVALEALVGVPAVPEFQQHGPCGSVFV